MAAQRKRREKVGRGPSGIDDDAGTEIADRGWCYKENRKIEGYEMNE